MIVIFRERLVVCEEGPLSDVASMMSEGTIRLYSSHAVACFHINL